MKNKYYKRSHISEKKFREIIKHFAHDLTAETCSRYTNISHTTIKNIYQKLRRKISDWQAKQGSLSGICEVDESYFGASRVRGKRGRGAGGKTIVFEILEREGKVFTQIVPDCQKKTLQKIIRKQISPETLINSDGWAGYDGLVDIGYGHFRVKHCENQFANGRAHVNGLESFWSFTKRRLAKFNGIPKHLLELHLKETEFRFNNLHENLYQIMLRSLRTDPI